MHKKINKKILRIAGVFFFSFGLMIIFNPLTRITGYSVAEDINENPFSLFSLVSIVLGMILFLAGLEKKQEDMQELIRIGLETPEESPKI